MFGETSDSNTLLPSKVGRPATSSPRTHENNKRRLRKVFLTSAPSHKATPHGSVNSAHKEPEDVDGERDEGCFVDATSYLGETELDKIAPTMKGGLCHLAELPTELIIKILTHLPASAQQLHTLALVSSQFRALSCSPVLWSRLFHSTPGFKLSSEAISRGIATNTQPRGRWEGDHWIWQQDDTASGEESTLNEPATDAIPIHYPTLYRSRFALTRQVLSLKPAHPAHTEVFTLHTDAVYCLQIVGRWLITGGRDRCLRIWRLGAFDTCGRVGSTKMIEAIVDGHHASLLSLSFEIGEEGNKGMLVTGSSDWTAGVWGLSCREDREGSGMQVERIGTLKGHEGGVLDVGLAKQFIITCSKDRTIRIYDRSTLSHKRTLTNHTGPVNCLSLHPDPDIHRFVSASGDGNWVVWDLETGSELRRGGGSGRGLACVDWQGKFIVTGDNDHIVKLWAPDSRSLLVGTFQGHADLVRTLALDLANEVIVSGSYDNSVRMWDMRTGTCLRVLNGHSSLVFAVELKEGRLVSSSHDKSVQVTTFGTGLPYRGLFS